MQIKKKRSPAQLNNNPQLKSHDVADNEQIKAKEGGVPMSVSAALGSLKKVKTPTAITGGLSDIKIPSAKTGGLAGQASANHEPMDTGHSSVYKERIKKRAK